LGFRIHFPFSVPGRIDRAAFLDAGDGRFVEIFGHTSTVQSEGRRRRPDEDRTEGALLHFCLRVADTDAAYARAIACGANPRVEPVSRQLSADPLVQVRIAFVTGPNGEVIELMQSGQI
jgi:glyoxylase I family protein